MLSRIVLPGKPSKPLPGLLFGSPPPYSGYRWLKFFGRQWLRVTDVLPPGFEVGHMHLNGDGKDPHGDAQAEGHGSVGYLLFDSLVHHLIEKGVLTRNDALSVVQTAAEVVRSRLHDGQAPSLQTRAALAILERTYSSFEAVEDRPGAASRNGHNVHRLRPPLHGDRPQFPPDD